MPTGIIGTYWDYDAQGMRVVHIPPRPDSIFNLLDVPNAVQNAGRAATETWLNANLGQRLWGPSSPPPYILTRVWTMSPFFFYFAISNRAIDPTYFDEMGTPPG